MGKYGKAAVRAVETYQRGLASTPKVAWELATTELFRARTPGQKKSCPRDAFLGLIQEGYVPSIPRGEYTKSELNRGYATRAAELLRGDSSLSYRPNVLWERVTDNSGKAHNSQMDVVIALWEHSFIAK